MVEMSDGSWELVKRGEPEKNGKYKKIKLSSNYFESDELMARKLQIIDICDKVAFIEAKHVPTIFINDKHSHSGVDNDIDSDAMSDIAGCWEDGGNWEKFDFSGMPIIPYKQWKMSQDLRKRHFNEQITNKRKKMLLHLLSENPKYLIYKERFLNPKMFFEPVRCRSLWQKCIDRYNDKIATEFFDSLDIYTVNKIDQTMKKGIIRTVDKITSITGENSIFLHTNLNYNYQSESGELLKDVVLKILKKTFVKYDTTLMAYKGVGDNMWELPDITHLTRQEIKSLATKESLILTKIKSLGIRCPEVVTLPQRLQRHIVVMSFLGKNQVPAPKLKYARLVEEYWFMVYEEVKQAMITMYKQAHLVHNDLLEHILWHDNHCYFIDFIHALDKNDKDAQHVLFKNCEAITKFFVGKRLKGILNAKQLFSEITKNGNKQKNMKTSSDYRKNVFLSEEREKNANF